MQAASIPRGTNLTDLAGSDDAWDVRRSLEGFVRINGVISPTYKWGIYWGFNLRSCSQMVIGCPQLVGRKLVDGWISMVDPHTIHGCL